MSAVTTALQPLIRALPVTPVEWADQNYYLPKESSYGEGEWKTLPFQIAIMNSMGNDQIRTVNLIKSARVGYTKMLLGVVGYFIEHKSRNSLLFQPTDSAAEDFMKSHVEATIRDVPCLKDLFPWLGRKHRDNTLTLKRFSSGVGFWCLGGAAAKNYREKSVDVVCYDELSSFEPDVEKEGSPTLLGDKRIEGSVWPKSIRGSTPKIKGTCQIEKAANESAHFMRFYVPCPHCGEEQYLKFGDESTPFGLKWEKDSPESVFYLCEHHGCVIHQSELDQSNGRWICENTGMWTRDGLTFFSAADNEIPPPRSITFHIWTAYSPFTTWVQIVYDWLDALKDPNGLKTFVNTTLGETWEEAVGEKLDHQVLMDKVVRYTAAVSKPLQQRGLLLQQKPLKQMQRLQQTMLLPLRRQPHRQPVQRRHRHHLRLLQKMRRPDKRQQRKVVPRQQQRKHQRRQAVRRLHLRAKLLLNPRQRAPRQQQNGQRILHPPWRWRMRARRKRG